MTISELKRTMNFVKKWVVDVDVPARFTNLMQILRQNAQQSGQQARPITTQKAELITAVKAIRIETLSLNERRLLSIFIDTNLMGNNGVEKINHASPGSGTPFPDMRNVIKLKLNGSFVKKASAEPKTLLTVKP